MIRKRRQEGFTLVELLVVMVVLGILAGIVAVNYRGTKERAIMDSLKSDSQNAVDAITQFQLDTTLYPTSINSCPTPVAGAVCLVASQGNTYTYTVNNGTTPPTFSLTTSGGGLSIAAP